MTTMITAGDDDNTWKVRRASVKVIQAFIVSFPSSCRSSTISTESLVGRLKEREDSVKTSIIICLEELMKATASRRRSGGGSRYGHVDLLERRKTTQVICRLVKDK